MANTLTLYSQDPLFKPVLEYLYDTYPDDICDFTYSNECKYSRYEYRRFRDNPKIKSVFPNECEFKFKHSVTDDSENTKEHEFHCKLDTDRASAVIRKGSNPLIDSYSAFFENDRRTATGLDGYFKTLGIEKIYLAGLATDFCVNYSAQDAAKLGYKVSVFEEMCRAIDLNGSLELARTEMRDCGVELI